ncbi:hypothetical protein BAE44_0015925 [Dichanthelium oligosanthes]|uniref:PGG domain-containing protein n=1 Tax=Dichanthelium oligosanthes TaxID=888268 RepID=A0A1E5VDC3_9POAL|nr:hypothetical protein BAE44_0015925 [Dichanthelium oligosanthes]
MASRTSSNSSSAGALVDEQLLEKAIISADASSMQEIASPNSSELPSVIPEAGRHQLTHLSHVESIADDRAATTSSPGELATTNNPSGGGAQMDRDLMKATVTGDAVSMKDLASQDPAVLLGTTPQGNTCLHIAAIHGHTGFCNDALALQPSLLAGVNSDGETPLLTAVTSGHASLASSLLRCCGRRDQRLMSQAILKRDRRGCNALQHAIRSGHRELALELIAAEPALSHAVNKYDESPMFAAAMRNYEDVAEKLLEIPASAHGGTFGYNALHAAVRNGNSGYEVSTDGVSLLSTAAFRGNVGVARELLSACPDAPCCDKEDRTCLHRAVWSGQTEFVQFVLGSQKLRKLVNAQDSHGETALHLAVRMCNPKLVAALLMHQDIDVTVHATHGSPPNWALSTADDRAKTLNWNEVSMLMLKADPKDASSLHNLHKQIKDDVENLSRKDIKSLTQTYTSNTSLVAILIATITFAAAFTLPGGYSSDAGSQGLPIMSRKLAFQAFLVSDTLAMCSSLAVAFVCVIARWEDLEFLLYYRSFTKKLMWFAYAATTTAFATGLYTVLAPHLLWLAIAICVVSVLLPVLTKLVGEWPVLKLRVRLGRTFNSDLLNMV